MRKTLILGFILLAAGVSAQRITFSNPKFIHQTTTRRNCGGSPDFTYPSKMDTVKINVKQRSWQYVSKLGTEGVFGRQQFQIDCEYNVSKASDTINVGIRDILSIDKCNSPQESWIKGTRAFSFDVRLRKGTYNVDLVAEPRLGGDSRVGGSFTYSLKNINTKKEYQSNDGKFKDIPSGSYRYTIKCTDLSANPLSDGYNITTEYSWGPFNLFRNVERLQSSGNTSFQEYTIMHRFSARFQKK